MAWLARPIGGWNVPERARTGKGTKNIELSREPKTQARGVAAGSDEGGFEVFFDCGGIYDFRRFDGDAAIEQPASKSVPSAAAARLISS